MEDRHLLLPLRVPVLSCHIHPLEQRHQPDANAIILQLPSPSYCDKAWWLASQMVQIEKELVTQLESRQLAGCRV